MPPVQGTPSPSQFNPLHRYAARSSTSSRGREFRSPGLPKPRAQFAPSPRFLLSASRKNGRHDNGNGEDIQESDSEEPERRALSQFLAVRRTNKPENGGCPRDLIEDFDEMKEGGPEEMKEHNLVPLRPLAATKSVEIGGDEGTISDSEQNTTELDDQFDILFPPTPDRWKRRRVSVGPDEPLCIEQGRRPYPRIDPISSGSDEPSSPSGARARDQGSSPLPGSPAPYARSSRSYPRTDPISSGSDEPSSPSGVRDQGSSPLPDSPPAPYARSSALRMGTPGPPSTNFRTPFRDHLRFQSRPTLERIGNNSVAKDGTPMSPPQSKRKPNFVVPRSPSLTHVDQDQDPQPAPFSPSSDSRLRGKARASVPNPYLPGGMASELRSWILEMGARRDRRSHIYYDSAMAPGAQKNQAPFLNYHIKSASTRSMPSCGSVILVRALLLTPLESPRPPPPALESDSGSGLYNIILIGPPSSFLSPYHRSPSYTNAETSSHFRSSRLSRFSTPNLVPEDKIAIYRGLAWGIELDAVTARNRRMSHDDRIDLETTIPALRHPHSKIAVVVLDERNRVEVKVGTSTTEPVVDREKWLVATEWDVLR